MRKTISILTALILLIGCLAGCAGRDTEKAPITTAEQLNEKGYTIGVGMGTSSVRDAGNVFPKAEVIEYNSVEDGYLAVQVGTLDAFVYSRASMEYAMASGSLKGVHLLEENVGEGTNVVVGISRKTEIPDLEARINAFIDEIHADGTMDDIYDRWVNRGVSTMPDIPEPEHPDCRITVGTSGTADRFSYYENGELVGSDLELIRRFASYMNAELELVVLDYIQLSAAAETGMVDCVFANLHATPEREEAMGFSKPLYVLENGVMVRGNDAAPAAAAPVSLADFDGKRIGVLTDSVHDAYVQKCLPNAQPQYFSNVSDQATALVSGALDAFSTDVLTARALIGENDKLTYLDEALGYIDTAFAFAKGQDGEALCGQMSDFLAKLTADGTMAALEEKWLSMGAGDYATDMSGLTGHGRTLTFATSCSGKPNAYYYNGAPTGFEVEIAAMFCREYGYNLDIQVTDFSSIIPGISTGKYDFGADGIMVTEERAQSVNFSVPDYHCSIVIVYRKDAAAVPVTAVQPRYTSISEMQGDDIKIGIEVGSCFEKLTLETFPNAQILYYDSLFDMPLSVSTGELDGFVCDEPMARLMANQISGVAYIPENLGSNDYAFAFPKTEEGKALCNQMSDFIRKLKSDGTLEKIATAWLDGDVSCQLTDRSDLTGENGTIRVATVGGTEPFCFKRDGQSVGFDLDIMTRFCREYGYGMEVCEMNLAAVIPSLGTTCDIGANGLCPTPERLEAVDFSESYYEAGGVIIVGTTGEAGAEEDSFWQSIAKSFEKTFIREQRWKLIVEGIGTTVFISFFAALFGTILGFGLCMLRRMRSRAVFGVTTVYIRVLQGTPLVVLLMVLYYLVFPKSGLPGEWVAVIAFALNFAAYVSEMMRTGIEAVDIGQTEAALALGFPKGRAFFKFILPQAAQHFLPVYKGEFISLVKMTSIVGYIAVQDLTKMSDIIRSRTYEAFFPLIATALIYFFISWLLSTLLRLVEIRTVPDRKNRTVKGVEMQ